MVITLILLGKDAKVANLISQVAQNVLNLVVLAINVMLQDILLRIEEFIADV